MTIKKPEIAIFCGGFGVRMYAMALGIQKCMIKVQGRPILEHLLEQVNNAFGKAKVTLLVGYDSKSVGNYFGRRYKKLELEYAEESTKGTRLALLSARNFIHGDHFFSIDGDIIVQGNEILDLAKFKTPEALSILLLSKKKNIAQTHGIATMKAKKILDFDFPPTKPLSGRYAYRFMGTAFHARRLFDRLHMTIVPTTSQVLIGAIKDGELMEGKICNTRWWHFESQQDLKAKIKF